MPYIHQRLDSRIGQKFSDCLSHISKTGFLATGPIYYSPGPHNIMSHKMINFNLIKEIFKD